MRDYLILRLQGVMQSWGGHTYEDYRPSGIFPTRSGLVGLIAACLGIDRDDLDEQQKLANSFIFAVRSDAGTYPLAKISDFHTVLEARKVSGKPNDNPVVSRREYLCDARFTVALNFQSNGAYTLEMIKTALQRPVYTPFLGRRSCPITAPLYEGVVSAENLLQAFSRMQPGKGTVYSEESEGSVNRLSLRDVPLTTGVRQFGSRTVFIHAEGGDYVSK